jgi:hypothetical protein
MKSQLMALANLETNSRFMMLNGPQWVIFRYNLWINFVNHTSIMTSRGNKVSIWITLRY